MGSTGLPAPPPHPPHHRPHPNCPARQFNQLSRRPRNLTLLMQYAPSGLRLSKHVTSISSSRSPLFSNQRAHRIGLFSALGCDATPTSGAKNEKTRSCRHDQVSSCAERRG